MNVADLSTPVLLVDVDRIERNIARMASKAADGGVALRPHFKTTKLDEVARMQIEAGAIGLTCATDRELEALLALGAESIMWAHQMVGAGKIELAIDANRRAEVMVAVDSLASAETLAARAAEQGVVVPCVIELDTGMRRAGVLPGAVPGLAQQLQKMPGLRLVGVMTHEGHVQRHLGDPDGLLAAAEEAWSELKAAAAACADIGIDLEVISAGATAAATLAEVPEGLTEIRPGTYVFLDANQVALGSAKWDDCAVTVLARVVSHNRPGHPVIDAGLKELSGDQSIRGVGHGHVVELDAMVQETYEEHAVLGGGRAGELQVGDLVRIIPNHVCGAVNMWSEIVAIRGNDVVGTWRTVGRR